MRRAVPAAAMVAAAVVYCERRRLTAGTTRRYAARLSTWVPPRLSRTGLRVAARIWAAPITLAGLAAGAASGVRPRVRDGVVLFAPARGVTGRLVGRRGFAATGLGHVIISITEPTPQLWAHELVHVRQAERLGPFMAPVYLGLLGVHGYANPPMELAARLGAASSARRSPGPGS